MKKKGNPCVKKKGGGSPSDMRDAVKMLARIFNSTLRLSAEFVLEYVLSDRKQGCIDRKQGCMQTCICHMGVHSRHRVPTATSTLKGRSPKVGEHK